MGIDDHNGKTLVRVDRRYFRPTEVDELVGDATKAQQELGWIAETNFDELVAEMVNSDLELIRGDRRAHPSIPAGAEHLAD